MKIYSLIILLIIPIFGQGQKNDSLYRMKVKVDSLMNKLNQLEKSFPESSLLIESVMKINKANREIDSLNLKIELICQKSSNNKIFQFQKIIDRSFNTLNYTLDKFYSLVNTHNENSTYYWTKDDSVCICDLKRVIIKENTNLTSDGTFFDDSTKIVINNFLKTDGDCCDLNRRFSNGTFSVEMVKLHILSLRRNIKKLQVRLLEYLIKNAS